MRSWMNALSALAVVWAAAVTAATQDGRAAGQTGAFSGRVVSAASGAGAAANPGHPVAGATVHLVPVTAIDTTTRMTASAIYAAPYPAEAYDEPLEDAIRLRGPASRRRRPTRAATSSSRRCPTASSSSMSRPTRRTPNTCRAAIRADRATRPSSCAANR